MVAQGLAVVNTSGDNKTSYRKTRAPLAKRRKVKAKTPVERRYWLDIGKAISLELTAAKYDQADVGGDGAQ